MRKVLVVAYAFPPVGGAGVQRVVKFVKYIRQFDWCGEVVSVLNPSVPIVDDSLLMDLPSDCIVYRARTLEPSYAVKASINASKAGRSLRVRILSLLKKIAVRMLIPDPQVLWWPHAVVLMRKILKRREHEVVFVSGPPFSAFVLAVFMAKLHRIPAVIDYRDEWTFSRDNWENSVKSPILRWMDSLLERYAVSNCAAITVASPFYERTLSERFPFAASKIHTITNGYDPDDFAKVAFPAPDPAKDFISIVYTGTVWRATSFQGFLEGVRLFALECGTLAGKLRLRIIGRILLEEEPIIEQLEGYIAVERVGYLPHEQIIEEIAAADLLLLTLADLEGAERIIPGKTFEYLAAPIPILAVVPQGVTAKLVGAESHVFLAEPGIPHAVKDALLAAVTSHGSTKILRGVKKYSREALAGKLATVLDETCPARRETSPAELLEGAK